MSDYEIHYIQDAVLIDVVISRATLKEAKEFKSLIENEIAKKKYKMIVDLSSCEFMDSTFVGVLVVTYKKLLALGGELRLVEPESIAHTILVTTGTLNIFKTYKSAEEAIANLEAA